MKSTSFHLKIEHLWGLTVLVGIFVFINTHPIRPNDFWWHIAIGREIMASGKIPTMDIYSYTAVGQPYPSYQMFWLMETTLYELFHQGGAALVVLIHSLLISSAYGIIFWICLRKSQSWRLAAFGTLFAAALGLNDWNIRPQGITFLLASLVLLGIYQYRHTHRWYWLILIPLSLVIWVNSHGTFIIGLALIGLWLGQELWDILFHPAQDRQKFTGKSVFIAGGMLILTILVCFINPRGVGIIDYVKTLTSNSVVQNLVTEWAAPSLNSSMGIVFFISLFGLFVLLAVSPKRPSFSQITAMIVFGLLAIKTSRGIVWFGIVLAPVVTDHLAAIIKQYQESRLKSLASQDSKVVNYLFMGVILLMGLISLPWFKSYLPLPAAKAGLISSETPIQATQFLLDHELPGRLFNSMSFGSYLIWAAYPQYQVFVDPRIELFPEKVWMDYLDISNASEDWQTNLKEYGVNTVFVNLAEQGLLIKMIDTSSDWQLIYMDNVAFIYSRIK